jgi:hypothetical protein
MRNLIVAAIAAGLIAIGGTASAQIVTGGAPAGPAPGSGNSTDITNDNQRITSEINQRMGASDVKARNGNDVMKKKAAAVPATAADIKAGASLRDVKGVKIGTIASSDGQQVVVDTGTTKIGVPLVAFGKDDQGLLLSITADKFNQLVAAAHAKSEASN